MKSPVVPKQRSPESSKKGHREAKRRGATPPIQVNTIQSLLGRQRCLRELAMMNGKLGDYSFAYFDPERVGPSTTHRQGRLYAEIHSEAKNETFWLSYNAGASFLLEKFTATADPSSKIVWHDGTLVQVRDSQDKLTTQ